MCISVGAQVSGDRLGHNFPLWSEADWPVTSLKSPASGRGKWGRDLCYSTGKEGTFRSVLHLKRKDGDWGWSSVM